MTDTLNFNAETAKAFQDAYQQALHNRTTVFTFQGKPVLTTYAKYVCEYLVMNGLLENSSQIGPTETH